MITSEWPRSREGFAKCICPISPGQTFDVAEHLGGIQIAFSRQGLHEFDPDKFVIERCSGGSMDIVAVFHPVP